MTTSGFRMDPEMITSHVQNLFFFVAKELFLPGGENGATWRIEQA